MSIENPSRSEREAKVQTPSEHETAQMAGFRDQNESAPKNRNKYIAYGAMAAVAGTAVWGAYEMGKSDNNEVPTNTGPVAEGPANPGQGKQPDAERPVNENPNVSPSDLPTSGESIDVTPTDMPTYGEVDGLILSATPDGYPSGYLAVNENSPNIDPEIDVDRQAYNESMFIGAFGEDGNVKSLDKIVREVEDNITGTLGLGVPIADGQPFPQVNYDNPAFSDIISEGWGGNTVTVKLLDSLRAQNQLNTEAAGQPYNPGVKLELGPEADGDAIDNNTDAYKFNEATLSVAPDFFVASSAEAAGFKQTADGWTKNIQVQLNVETVPQNGEPFIRANLAPIELASVPAYG